MTVIVKLKRNIRYDNQSSVIGEEIEINRSDLEEFIKSDVIEDIDLSLLGNESDGVTYIGMTNKQLIEILTERGIEHNPKDKKEILINLLMESDQVG